MLIAIIVLLALILPTFIFILIGIALNYKNGQKDAEEVTRILGECLGNIQKRIESIHKIEDQNGNLLLLIIDLLNQEKEKKDNKEKR